MEKEKYAQTNEKEIAAGLDTGEFGAIGQTPQKFESTHAGGGHSVVAEKLGKKYEGIGRNDLCPCGSGKKFKKCHGAAL